MNNIENIKILDVQSKRGSIYLIGRDIDKKRVILEKNNSFFPYYGDFYIKKGCETILDELSVLIEMNINFTSKKSLFGDELLYVKYNVKDYREVKLVREIVSQHRDVIFEGDLLPRTSYCLDELPKLGVSFDGDWHIGYIDIETETHGIIPDPNNPIDKVLCFTFYSSYDKLYYFFYWGDEVIDNKDGIVTFRFNDEEDMLKNGINFIKDCQIDIITGWNINFDVSYLLKRYLYIYPLGDNDIKGISPLGSYYYNDKYKQFSIPGLIIFDLLDSYKRIVRNQLISFKLDDVAFEELGENKVEVDVKNLKSISKTELLKYNKKDVELCVKIDKKVNIISFFDGLRQFVGCPMDDVRYSRSIIDFIVLKKARKLGVVLPTANQEDSVRPHYEGAYVDAVPGCYRNVIAFDLKSLYPSIIKTFNLSPECIDKDGEVILPELTISLKNEGIIPSIVDDLMILRQTYDNERDKYPAGHPLHEKNDILVESAKLVVDAIYGMCAYPKFRLYEPRIASSITYCGREIIHHTKDFIENRGHRVVVTDTDSSYWVSSEIAFDKVINEGQEMLSILNEDYLTWTNERWNIQKCYLKNVFKKVYQKIIICAKKRYGGHVIWAKGKLSDKIEIVGLECKRSDYSRFTKLIQFQLIEMILRDDTDENISNFMLSKVNEMKRDEYINIGIPTKIEKSLDSYVTNLPKVRGAKFVSSKIGVSFGIGDKPLMLFTVGDSDIILFLKNDEVSKLLQWIRIDWQKMVERNILLPSHQILENSGYGYLYNKILLLSINQTTLF